MSFESCMIFMRVRNQKTTINKNVRETEQKKLVLHPVS